MLKNEIRQNFKEEALKLSDDIGLKKAASQLGIDYFMLAAWRSKRKSEEKEPPKRLSPAEQRIKKLELENQELRRANDILKDALGFFAKDQKK